MTTPPDTLPFAELETAYEHMAEAIDSLPGEQQRLFLAKLCLALAHRVSDPARVTSAIEEARRDLDSSE